MLCIYEAISRNFLAVATSAALQTVSEIFSKLSGLTNLNLFLVGGSQRYREHWDKFLNDSKIILYVIDSCEKDVLPASLDALKSLVINNGKEDIPIVVVFSKRDCSTAIPVQELISFVEKENLGERIYKYTEVQVKCGGADTTKGVNQLREILVELARSS